MAAASTSASLKEYLKRYESGGAEDPKKAKKAKKKKKKKPAAGGVLIVDEDPAWQKPIKPYEEDEESEGEEEPVVDEDVEVKRLKRLELLRSRKPYLAISDDGSGWVSISDEPKGADSASGAADLSPPRQRRSRFNAPSPDHGRPKPSGSGDSDLSPPRQRRRRHHSPLPEPQSKPLGSDGAGIRRRQGEEHSPPAAQFSPPRRRKRGSSEDLSPPRRDHQHSPKVRERRGSVMADLSPPRRRKGSLEDLSPPRRGSRRSPEADLSPSRRTKEGSSGDISPPRRARRHSPEAIKVQDSSTADLSPQRRGRRGSAEDLSLPRQVRHDSPWPDFSPSRRGRGDSPEDISSPRRVRHRSPQTDSFPPRESRKKVPSAKEERRAGLFTGSEIKEEINRKKKDEISRFAALDPVLSGKGAEPVYRDKEGKRISKEEMLKLQKGEEKPKEKKLEWGKGLAQKREAEARAAELDREKNEPFARTRDDPGLDKMLKEKIRWGDPMAHLVKRKQSDLDLEDLGDDEKMKESGFIIPQTIPNHSWIKRGIDPPSNRYGIRPGRHWDGVDRSSGFEKEMFKRQSEKRATETEAYLWSVSDM